MDDTQAEKPANLEVSSLKHLAVIATQDGRVPEVQVSGLMSARLSKTMISVSGRAYRWSDFRNERVKIFPEGEAGHVAVTEVAMSV